MWVQEVPVVSVLLQTPHMLAHGLSALALWKEALSSADICYSESHRTLAAENHWEETVQRALGILIQVINLPSYLASKSGLGIRNGRYLEQVKESLSAIHSPSFDTPHRALDDLKGHPQITSTHFNFP